MQQMKDNYLPKDYCNLYYSEKIKSWDEAIPLGNGLLGCLVWGDGCPLRFSLDRGDLWDTRASKEILADDFKYEKLIEYVKNNEQDKIKACFEAPFSAVTPTKIPAGKIFADFGAEAQKMESRLEISHGEARIQLSFGQDSAIVQGFVHATENSGFIKISGTDALPRLIISNPDFGVESTEAGMYADHKANISNGSLRQLGYPPPRTGQTEATAWFVQKTAEGMEYGILLAFAKKNGTLEAVYTVAASMDGDNWFENAMAKVTEQLTKGYDKSFIEHKLWWEEFWNKSSVRLPDKEFEKHWYLTNYFFGSCSRKNSPPMPLQGVWTADNGELPPWKGDYHNDLNTQFSYMHYLKANHLEEGECFIDFLWKLRPAARKFAAEFFDAPGLCLPSTMSIDGKALGGWAMYSYNITNQIWLCMSFEMYWRYTGDMEFLRDKAYTYFEETAACALRWLLPDEQGKLLLPLSSSPEIHDDLPGAWLTPNSNYDLALLRYLFITLTAMADTLKNGKAPYWRSKLDKLHELAVNKSHELMLCRDETLEESHRHHSHAIAIYPLKILDYGSERDRAVIDASVARLEMLGSGLWVGFGFTWMAEFYAVQGNGEGAAYQLKLFWENFCSANGFNLNGDYKKRGVSWWHYRPFTLETNMCAADALQEMLLQNDGHILKIFPAIPEQWRQLGVSFGKLRGWNGILVSAEMREQCIVEIELEAAREGEFLISNSFDLQSLSIERQGQIIHMDCNGAEYIKIYLNKGEKAFIRPVR